MPRSASSRKTLCQSAWSAELAGGVAAGQRLCLALPRRAPGFARTAALSGVSLEAGWSGLEAGDPITHVRAALRRTPGNPARHSRPLQAGRPSLQSPPLCNLEIDQWKVVWLGRWDGWSRRASGKTKRKRAVRPPPSTGAGSGGFPTPPKQEIRTFKFTNMIIVMVRSSSSYQSARNVERLFELARTLLCVARETPAWLLQPPLRPAPARPAPFPTAHPRRLDLPASVRAHALMNGGSAMDSSNAW